MRLLSSSSAIQSLKCDRLVLEKELSWLVSVHARGGLKINQTAGWDNRSLRLFKYRAGDGLRRRGSDY